VAAPESTGTILRFVKKITDEDELWIEVCQKHMLQWFGSKGNCYLRSCLERVNYCFLIFQTVCQKCIHIPPFGGILISK
jgi:hypothetical protein